MKTFANQFYGMTDLKNYLYAFLCPNLPLEEKKNLSLRIQNHGGVLLNLNKNLEYHIGSYE